MFFRQPAGAGGPQIYSIDLTGYNEQLVSTPTLLRTRLGRPCWSRGRPAKRPDFAAFAPHCAFKRGNQEPRITKN
jgi:hypothetical protein